jgi:hypothetical protein
MSGVLQAWSTQNLFLINHRVGEVIPNRPHLGAVSEPNGSRMQPAENLDTWSIDFGDWSWVDFGDWTQSDTQKREDQPDTSDTQKRDTQ